MPNGYHVEFDPEVTRKDLDQLPGNLRTRIIKAVEERLTTHPDQYGRRLRQSLIGLWRLRVGDYRIVFELRGRIVRIWAIAHRREVYEAVMRRWVRR